MKKIIALILVGVICLGAGFGAGYFWFVKRTDKPMAEGETTINAVIAEVTLGESLFEVIASSPVRWKNALVDNYGMSSEKRDDVIAHPENWLAFNLFINIHNPNDTEMIIDSFVFPDNGKKGLYFMNKLPGQVSIAPRATDQICVYFFLDDNDPSLEEVAEQVKGLDMYVKYTPMPEDLEAEIPEESYHTAKVVAQ